MTKAISYTSAILLVVNLLFGFILSSYEWINVAISSSTIVITMLLCILGNQSIIKDGFKVALILLFAIIGLLEYLIAVIMPSRFADNWCLIVIFLLLGLEVFLLIVANITSTKIG